VVGEGGVGMVEVAMAVVVKAAVMVAVVAGGAGGVGGGGGGGRGRFVWWGGGGEGAEVSFLVRVIRGGVEVERYPERGLIEFRGPMRALDMKNWYI